VYARGWLQAAALAGRQQRRVKATLCAGL
jgi:hypothetical protein